MDYDSKRNLILVLATISISLLLLNSESSFSLQEPTKTILTLHKFEEGFFNGGQIITFQGKLSTESGNRIPDVKIIIKNDGPCPENYVIAEGVTGKDGLFWIYTIAKVWDESDNLITIHAEFGGNETFLPSASQAFPIVVYPVNAEKCTN
jgi:hypothetical protein